MALVKLKRNWFANGVRYRARNGWQEIPDELLSSLPSDAERKEAAPAAEKPAPKPAAKS